MGFEVVPDQRRSAHIHAALEDGRASAASPAPKERAGGVAARHMDGRGQRHGRLNGIAVSTQFKIPQ